MRGDPPGADPRSFLTLLTAAESGELLGDLNDGLQSLVAAMRQQQNARGGTPTAALSVGFALKLEHGGEFEIVATVNVKEPKKQRSRTIMYPLSDNTLSPNNPKQITMDLAPRQMDAPAAMKIV